MQTVFFPLPNVSHTCPTSVPGFFLFNSVPVPGFCTSMPPIPELNASKGGVRYGGAELSLCRSVTWRECDQREVTR